jgi:hypothetical protein
LVRPEVGRRWTSPAPVSPRGVPAHVGMLPLQLQRNPRRQGACECCAPHLECGPMKTRGRRMAGRWIKGVACGRARPPEAAGVSAPAPDAMARSCRHPCSTRRSPVPQGRESRARPDPTVRLPGVVHYGPNKALRLKTPWKRHDLVGEKARNALDL